MDTMKTDDHSQIESLTRQILEQPIPRQLPCDCLMPQSEYRKTELCMNPELHPAHPDHSPDVMSLCAGVGIDPFGNEELRQSEWADLTGLACRNCGKPWSSHGGRGAECPPLQRPQDRTA